MYQEVVRCLSNTARSQRRQGFAMALCCFVGREGSNGFNSAAGSRRSPVLMGGGGTGLVHRWERGPPLVGSEGAVAFSLGCNEGDWAFTLGML